MQRILKTKPALSNEVKRVSKKKRKPVPKSVYGEGGHAPFYDPLTRHTHIWTHGTIPAIEIHTRKNKTFMRKPYTGMYCKVCHEVSEKFTMDSSTPTVDYFDIQEIKLKEDMKKLRISQQLQSTTLNWRRVMGNWRRIVGKVLHNRVWEIRHPMDSVTEELFLKGVECTFMLPTGYKHPVSKKTLMDFWSKKGRQNTGIIVSQLPNKDVQIHTSHGNYIIPPSHVFPNQQEKPHLTPIGKVPRSTKKVGYWKNLWNNYYKWKCAVSFMKDQLPEISQYFQTLYEDEIADPTEVVVEEKTLYKKDTNKLKMIDNFNSKLNKKQIELKKLKKCTIINTQLDLREKMLYELCPRKNTKSIKLCRQLIYSNYLNNIKEEYKIFNIFMPTEGIFKNYVTVKLNVSDNDV